MLFIRHYLPTLCLTLFLSSVAVAQNPTTSATTDAVIYTKHGEVPLKLELAITPEARVQGLMNRESIQPLDGMLFIFPEPHDYHFWMKNTPIPLDMLFVRQDHTVAHIEENVPPRTLAERSADDDAICAVIELDGGRASREGIAEGDHVRYEIPAHMEIR